MANLIIQEDVEKIIEQLNVEKCRDKKATHRAKKTAVC